MTFEPDFVRARTARHRRLPEIGDGGVQRLADARVAVVGAGGLGSTVIPYLAAAGWIALLWGQELLDWYAQFLR